MPELPEVETVLRGLSQRVIGRRIEAVEILNPLIITGLADRFPIEISGRTIAGIRRKGKTLAVELAGRNGAVPHYLLVRLGMTGQVLVSGKERPLQPHTHVRLLLEGGTQDIRYRDVRRFGRLRSCTEEELHAIWSQLGPDAPDISETQFFESTRGRRGSMKAWLLNQRILSGLGNIYADEALFRARIHPLAQPGRLSRQRVRRLHRAVKEVLKRAVELQGTSFRDYIDIEGRPGNFSSRLQVYQRTGEACRSCGHAIRRLVIAGRSSHFCPHCQPRPRQSTSSSGTHSRSTITRK